jgi:hypothetical protein
MSAIAAATATNKTSTTIAARLTGKPRPEDWLGLSSKHHRVALMWLKAMAAPR